MIRRLPHGANWLDAIYRPRKVARLRRKQLEGAGPGFKEAQFAALIKKYHLPMRSLWSKGQAATA